MGLFLLLGCGSGKGGSTDGRGDAVVDAPGDAQRADAPGAPDAVTDLRTERALDAVTDLGTDVGIDSASVDASADAPTQDDAADAANAPDAASVDAPSDLGPDGGASGSLCPDAGVPCTGPAPACASACADTDGDGLNDAWESAQGIDMNCDGVIDAAHDVLLPGADPNRPDIYVSYDWLDYGGPGNACSADRDCPALASGHAGERCAGPQVVPAATGSCSFACAVDADCTSRAQPGAHASDKCRGNVCVHTHDPEATAPGALQAVADAFAAHGIALHVLRGNARPHSEVVSFRRGEQMVDDCEGGSTASGTGGLGKYAVSLYDLKALAKIDASHLAYHYAVFAHYAACDTQGHCDACLGTVATNPDGTYKAAPVPGQSGIAELSGNDFIVSLGNRAGDIGLGYDVITVGGTFMHELGHNLGLHHGGGIDSPCSSDADCPGRMKCEDTPSGKLCFGANDDNWKPNYLSVMNYRYQFSGITPAKVSGGVEAFACAADADCPAHLYCHGGVCSRVDYSAERLPTGGNTPGALEESTLDGLPGLSEPAGLGGATSDVFTYTDARCDIPPTTAATVGPVDWDGDGNTDATAVSADLTAGGDHPCGKVQLALLAGAADWGGPFTYKFQCTSFGGPDGDGSSSSSSSSFPWRLTRELTTHEAMAAHALYPPRSVRAILGDGSARIMRARNRIGSVRVILLGAPGFAMADVDTASIVFHGARPVTVTLRDVNRDGRPDLVAAFDSARLRLHPKATRARIRGSLASSQLFTAEIALP